MDARLIFSILAVVVTSNGEDRVTIRSTWGGLGEPQDQTLTFTCTPNLRTASNRRCGNFRKLLSTLDSPVTTYSPASIGLTPEWLAANVDEAVKHDLPRLRSAGQLKLFRGAFADNTKTDTLIRSLGSSGIDDMPRVALEATDSSGNRIRIQSEDPSECMLPWTIEQDGKTVLAYDRRIGDAIYSLLPKKFPNRERIGGRYLREEYSAAVLRSIRKEWNLVGSRERLTDAFERVSNRFEVLESGIVSMGSIDVGAPPNYFSDYGWNAVLRDPKMDGRFTIGMFAPMPRDRNPEIRPFLQRIDGFIALVDSLPWLHDVMTNGLKAKVQLRFVGERSFSLRAAASMIGDLRANGLEGLATLIEEQASTCAFLEIDNDGSWSRWAVLPDRRAVLWHFRGSPLGFALSDYRTWDYLGWNSVGAVVSPEGELSKPW